MFVTSENENKEWVKIITRVYLLLQYFSFILTTATNKILPLHKNGRQNFAHLLSFFFLLSTSFVIFYVIFYVQVFCERHCDKLYRVCAQHFFYYLRTRLTMYLNMQIDWLHNSGYSLLVFMKSYVFKYTEVHSDKIQCWNV